MKTLPRIHAALLMIVGLLSAISLALALATGRFLSVQASDARVINIAGRQRMLCQEIAKKALLISTGAPQERDSLRGIAGRFDASHRALLNGDAEIGIPETTDPAALAQMRVVDPLEQGFYKDVLLVLATDSAASEFSAATQRLLRENEQYALEMDRAVLLYEQAVAKKADKLQWALAAGAALALLTGATTWIMLGRIVTGPVVRILADEHGRTIDAIESMQDGFALFDKEDRLVVCNERYRTTIPRLANVLVPGALYSDLVRYAAYSGQIEGIAGQEEDWIRKHLSEHREQGRAYEKCLSGGRWIEYVEQPIRSGGVVCIRRDITERKQAEESRRLHSSALNAAANGIVITDRQGAIQWVNSAFTALTAYSAEEAMGQNHRALLRSGRHDSKFYKDLWDTILAGRVWQGELVNRRKDGSLYEESQTITPVRNEQGEISHFIGIKQDITDRRLREQELTDREANSRAIVQNVINGVVSINEDGLILVFNGSAEHMFGHAAAEVIGKNVSILMPEPYRSQHDSYLKNYRRTGVGKVMGRRTRVSGLRKDGTTFPMQLGLGEYFIGGQRRFIASVQDLTESEALEAQLRQAQKMEAIGQLTGGLAHDFNNILTVIAGSVEMLEQEEENPPHHAPSVATIGQAVERGAELTRRLLAFSRKQTLSAHRLDLNEVVAGMEKMLHRTIQEPVSIRTVPEEELWPISADRAQLENALLNLVVNARDALPTGGKITIKTANVELDQATAASQQNLPCGEYVTLTVSDDGTGMSPEVVARAFEPFFTTKEVGKGSGLGLSMVYGFVRQSGGQAKIQSQPGQGTSVTLYFPRLNSAASSPAQPRRESHGPLPGTEHILFVDDEEAILIFVKKALERIGYRVTALSDSVSAYALFESDPSRFDIVVTDRSMPRLPGEELARKIKNLRPGVPVVLCSGYCEIATADRLRAGEIQAVLPKPFDAEQLSWTIRSVLGNHDTPSIASIEHHAPA